MSNQSRLAAVRTAYRYVIAYERRVLDAVAAVGDTATELGFEFHRWTPLYRSFPSRVKFGPANWAWDNVPFYAAQYHWDLQGRCENGAGNAWLILDHIADTGFLSRTTSQGEPDPLSHLSDATSSDSILRAWWIRLDAPVEPRLWAANWHDLIRGHFGHDNADLFASVPTRTPRLVSGVGGHLGVHVVSLAALEEPGDLATRFLDPLKAQMREHAVAIA